MWSAIDDRLLSRFRAAVKGRVGEVELAVRAGRITPTAAAEQLPGVRPGLIERAAAARLPLAWTGSIAAAIDGGRDGPGAAAPRRDRGSGGLGSGHVGIDDSIPGCCRSAPPRHPGGDAVVLARHRRSRHGTTLSLCLSRDVPLADWNAAAARRSGRSRTPDRDRPRGTDQSLTVERVYDTIDPCRNTRSSQLVATLAVADPARCDRAALSELVARRRSGSVAGSTPSTPSLAAQASRLAEPAATLLAAEGRRSAREARAVSRAGRGLRSDADAARGAGRRGGVGRSRRRRRPGCGAVGRRCPRRARRRWHRRWWRRRRVSSVEAFEREVRDLERAADPRRRASASTNILRRQRLAAPVGRPPDRAVPHPRRARSRSPTLGSSPRSTRPSPTERATAEGRGPTDVRAAAGRRLRRDWPPPPATTGRRPARGRRSSSITTRLRDGLHGHSVCETADGQPAPTRRRSGGWRCDADDHPRRPRRRRRRARPTAAPAGSPPPSSDEHSGRCTERAATPAARSGSPTARSTTSSNGSANVGRPTSTTCSRSAHRHHHLVHEGGWHLTLHPDRTITLRRPDGTVRLRGLDGRRRPGGCRRWLEPGDAGARPPRRPARRAMSAAWMLLRPTHALAEALGATTACTAAADHGGRRRPRRAASTETSPITATRSPIALQEPLGPGRRSTEADDPTQTSR